ncbi:putative acetyltransferase [Caldalkalibacillus uzonensis]|uniref:Acetyltransferase n=1 Tax=Caldalkalibacillus uzonensis TaxID=353224 RepID=A0ABU0CN72_9BACI|nr:GNAT family N-acetyltransferase [Caldalkalibacillus uzonensis]MDQ0337602.1 putative acetyltransferase [Caldalkalibacillus uzonensis]
MAEIRRLTEADMDESFRLSQFAFQYTLSEDELAERLKEANPAETLCCFIDGQLASKLTILPLAIYLHGERFPMGGIADVATWPEYRRQGLVRLLMQQALKQMKDDGQIVSLLAPFRYSFYDQFGWGKMSEYKHYELKVEEIPRFPRLEGRIHRLDRGESHQLYDIYDRFARRYNGMLARKPDWWEKRVLKRKQGTIAVYENVSGTKTGYVLYEVKDRQMTIHEWVALDGESFRSLWHFIAMHDSMIDRVTCDVPQDDPLPFLLPEPRIKQEVVPYFMCRVVDVEAILASYPFEEQDADIRSPLFIHVEDRYAPWNQGTFQVSWMDGTRKVSVFYPKEKGQCVHPPNRGIRCSIQVLSSMLFGYGRPETWYACGQLQGNAQDVQRLERMIPRRIPHLLDFF